MGIKQTLIQSAGKFARLSYEDRVKKMYEEVIQYAVSQANMGNLGAKFDAYWDNSPEARTVCRMLHQDGLLNVVTTYAEEDDIEDVDITDSILNTDVVSAKNCHILALYLRWTE